MTGNQAGHLSVHRTVLNQLSHSGWGLALLFKRPFFFFKTVEKVIFLGEEEEWPFVLPSWMARKESSNKPCLWSQVTVEKSPIPIWVFLSEKKLGKKEVKNDVEKFLQYIFFEMPSNFSCIIIAIHIYLAFWSASEARTLEQTDEDKNLTSPFFTDTFAVSITAFSVLVRLWHRCENQLRYPRRQTTCVIG